MAKEDGNSSVESMMKSGVDSGATKSNFDNSNSNNVENSVATTSDSDREYSVEYSNEHMVRGSKAVEELNYAEAVRCFKRALEIRLAYFGQRTLQCADAYNEYGCALMYEAGAVKNDFLITTPDDVVDKPCEWKLLDIAEGIIEKHSDLTMENVYILLALAEVAKKEMKNEISVSYLLKALSMLEQLVEPNSLLIAEVYYKICKSWDDGCKVDEAIPYCETGLSICESRMDSLMEEVNYLLGPEETYLRAKLNEMARVTRTRREMMILLNTWMFQLLKAFSEHASDNGDDTSVDPSSNKGDDTSVDPISNTGDGTSVDPSSNNGDDTSVDPISNTGDGTSVDPSSNNGDDTSVDPISNAGDGTSVDASSNDGDGTSS